MDRDIRYWWNLLKCRPNRITHPSQLPRCLIIFLLRVEYPINLKDKTPVRLARFCLPSPSPSESRFTAFSSCEMNHSSTMLPSLPNDQKTPGEITFFATNTRIAMIESRQRDRKLRVQCKQINGTHGRRPKQGRANRKKEQEAQAGAGQPLPYKRDQRKLIHIIRY